MKKFREIGYGNRWFIRTEFEHEDGTESEVKGFTKPFSLRSVYVRAWIGKKVMIIDSKEGIKLMNKNEKKVKIILGFFGY
ncbi:MULTISPECIES: DUF3977 family protein [Paenibacillus]|uniref:DUF3977 family protein n=1 Tax=Paenibacillus xylanilyticus TaxID=248903 RepID=A0A7Y6EXM1_9BACL|nr:DUF3977 family protein [Paenibacillus xylanilyticus]NUU77620.1 DUF3977 family protein [Paenibacillus xylanilyticus]